MMETIGKLDAESEARTKAFEQRNEESLAAIFSLREQKQHLLTVDERIQTIAGEKVATEFVEGLNTELERAIVDSSRCLYIIQ